jgi:Response regulators consisting of a CheY-like receiver domain and a winged-helix DNA-binding domain
MAGSDPVVLIVEDEPDVAETYRLWLNNEYEVEVARNGEAGLDRLDESVDVVLLDRMIPGASGDEVLDQIREQKLDCRVAMVTAVEPDFDILEMGFDTYLSKPVGGKHLSETVETLLERAEYNSLLQEYYSLVEKRATLLTSKSKAQLAGNEEYERLEYEIELQQERLAETLGGIENNEDFVATIRGLVDAD